MFAFGSMFVSGLAVFALVFALAIVVFALWNGSEWRFGALWRKEEDSWRKSRAIVHDAEDAHASALRTAFREVRKIGRVRGANARIAYAAHLRGDSPSLAIAPWIQVTPAMRTNQRATLAMSYSVKRASELLAWARAERERGRYHVARLILSHAKAHVARAEAYRDGRAVA